MRPLKLSLAGFGPFLSPQEISFDDIGLFAITGPTGAGKSSLLDAISFALFGITPRLGKALAELRNPYAERAQVVLEFAQGAQVYRVTRVFGTEPRHSARRLEALQDGDFRMVPETERASDLERKLAGEILGIDAESFFRAALLPQGQFDQFLRGTAAERGKILRELYGLEFLEQMREGASAHKNQAQQVAGNYERDLGYLAAITPEALAEQEAQLQALEDSVKQAQAELQSLQAESAELRLLSEQFGRLVTLQRDQAIFESQVSQRQLEAELLRQAEAARSLIPIWQQIQAGVTELSQQAQKLSGQEGELFKLQAQKAEAQAQFNPERELELGGILEQIPWQREQERLLQRAGGSLALSHPEPLEFSSEAWDSVNAGLEAWNEYQKQIKRVQEAEAAGKSSQQKLTAEQEKLANRQTELNQVEAELAPLSVEVSQAEARLAQAEAQAGLERYHHLLQVGEACPLCGQPVQILPEPVATPLEPLRLQVKQKRARLAQLEKEQARLHALIEAAHANLRELQAQLDSQNQALIREQALANHLSDQLPTGFTRPELESRRQRLLAGLAAALGSFTGGIPVEQYHNQVQAERATLRSAQTRFLELEKQESQLNMTILAARATLAERQRSQAERQAELDTLLAEQGFANSEALRGAAMGESELKRRREALQQAQRAGEHLALELARLQGELAAKTPPPPGRLEALTAREVELTQQIQSGHLEQGRLSEKIKQTREGLLRKVSLEADLAQAKAELELWSQLSSDLHSHHFPAFLLRRYQVELAQGAAELLRVFSSGRYGLTLQEDQYAVADSWLGTVRPARTLSGGETFLASLSLALALSERLSGGRLEALFLDEGFGTLDSETLETAAGVLQALPLGGRMVGVVTHVEALAARLPARLRVEKRPEGSRVFWED